MWTTLSVLAAIAMFLFWRGPNAVGGGLTIGFVGGIITASVSFFRGTGFHWSTVGHWVVVCILAGFAMELIGRLIDRIDKKL